MISVFVVLTTAVVLATIAVVRFHQRRNRYPPGPLPLPFLGNLLSFRCNTPFTEVLSRFRSVYGDVLTVWIGERPIVFICNWKVTKEVLISKKNDFAGRMDLSAFQMFMDGTTDVAMSDPSLKWEIIRKLAYAAVRKYAVSEEMRDCVVEVTDDVIDDLLSKSVPFSVREEVLFIILNITTGMAFGKKYSKDDVEFKHLQTVYNGALDLFIKLIPSDFVPFLKLFQHNRVKSLIQVVAEVRKFFTDKFLQKKAVYNGEVHNFTDAVLCAREEADPEDNYIISNLNDKELSQIVNVLFNAGRDTMDLTLNWIILYLSVHKEIQDRAAEEVLRVIGGEPPSQEDRLRCPFTWAVIMEVLRMRTPVALLVPHKAMRDSSADGHPIPRGTPVIFPAFFFHFDKTHWKDPERFRPDRFLEEPEVTKSHYFPFGIGRRACVGERMAQATLFIALARFLQRTSFTLCGQPNMEPDENPAFCTPRPFKVTILPRKEFL